MTVHNYPIATAADLLKLLAASDLPAIRCRDLASAVNRICELNGLAPAGLRLEIPALRAALDVNPAKSGMKAKNFSNVRSAFIAAVEWAGLCQAIPRGLARRDPIWAPLAAAIAGEKELSLGLAAFMNWCAENAVAPVNVDDGVVERFQNWLVHRTLYITPRPLLLRIPKLWNEARERIPGWPDRGLARITFKAPSLHLPWQELPASFRADAEAYLAMRRAPDMFEDRASYPKRPIAESTVRLQSEHIRLAASILVRQGKPSDELASLADLVEPTAFKAVLRHYHNQAGGKPNAFAVALGKTFVAIARYHVELPDAALAVLKGAMGKLPPVPLELTEKNKALLAELEGDHAKAQLLFLPEKLLRKAAAELERGRMPIVDAQVAIAVDILLVAPLRPQNLCALNWRKNFREPNGPKGILQLYVPKGDTKSGKRDITLEIPADVARHIRWFRREILGRIGADPNGDLFVTVAGIKKSQETLSQQITERLAKHLGVHMTPHQFRHAAAYFYLEQHPDDFQTVTDLLGHAWAKTTLVYAGSSSRRASRVYGRHVVEQREALKLKRHARKGRTSKCSP